MPDNRPQKVSNVNDWISENKRSVKNFLEVIEGNIVKSQFIQE